MPIRKTVGTQSVSGASKASRPKPSVEYSQNKLGKTKTVTDGNTSVKYSRGQDEIIQNYLAENIKPGRGRRGASAQYPPCINPTCKSYGRSHPNCLCYSGPGGSSLEEYAHGGSVCSGVHKEECEHFADGGTVAENMMMHTNPKDTLDHVALHHGLLGLLTKTGHSKSEDKNKHLEDYVDHSRRGHKTIHDHMENLFNQHHVEPDKNSRESLKNHLQFLREHPENLLDVGGNLGDNLPAHATHLAAKAGDAIRHFNTIKPKQIQSHPLDEISPVDKREDAVYDRHIDIAQNPAVILNHVKDGTLLPSDLSTLTALYPELHKSIVSKAGEALISAKTKGMEIPYKQKQSLSLLLGQPLDSTMTPQSMQAIINSSGKQQAQQQQKNSPKRASNVELKQIDKTNDLYETPLEARQIRKNK